MSAVGSKQTFAALGVDDSYADKAAIRIFAPKGCSQPRADIAIFLIERKAVVAFDHTNPKTTEKHYNQARQVEAGRKLNAALSSVHKRVA
ncbi:hypothetical protein [Ruegeria sp. 6PALISEP08]|uniref:hypothetical protein n=1 Tax=Ruegeria sp. 6PALISEP08 TaxID=1225660 RepID=UPI00067F427D|nr:hypothetical protein [Ruegeria sp. 6PALISEP08]